jgi:hypothetical protein
MKLLTLEEAIERFGNINTSVIGSLKARRQHTSCRLIHEVDPHGFWTS